MTTLTLSPAFTHDCAQCRFIGHVAADGARAAYDLIAGCDGTVIARTGDDGADYLCARPEVTTPMRNPDSVMGHAFATLTALRAAVGG